MMSQTQADEVSDCVSASSARDRSTAESGAPADQHATPDHSRLHPRLVTQVSSSTTAARSSPTQSDSVTAAPLTASEQRAVDRLLHNGPAFSEGKTGFLTGKLRGLLANVTAAEGNLVRHLALPSMLHRTVAPPASTRDAAQSLHTAPALSVASPPSRSAASADAQVNHSTRREVHPVKSSPSARTHPGRAAPFTRHPTDAAVVGDTGTVATGQVLVRATRSSSLRSGLSHRTTPARGTTPTPRCRSGNAHRDPYAHVHSIVHEYRTSRIDQLAAAYRAARVAGPESATAPSPRTTHPAPTPHPVTTTTTVIDGSALEVSRSTSSGAPTATSQTPRVAMTGVTSKPAVRFRLDLAAVTTAPVARRLIPRPGQRTPRSGDATPRQRRHAPAPQPYTLSPRPHTVSPRVASSPLPTRPTPVQTPPPATSPRGTGRRRTHSLVPRCAAVIPARYCTPSRSPRPGSRWGEELRGRPAFTVTPPPRQTRVEHRRPASLDAGICEGRETRTSPQTASATASQEKFAVRADAVSRSRTGPGTTTWSGTPRCDGVGARDGPRTGRANEATSFWSQLVFGMAVPLVKVPVR